MAQKASPKRYQQLEHVGDIQIKVFGDSIEDLFLNAGFALFDLITDADKIKHELAEQVEVSGIDREELLVNWLSELNYLFITENKLFSEFEIERMTENEMTANLLGEKFKPHSHTLKNEIKAVTFHDLMIVKVGKHWETKIVFDI